MGFFSRMPALLLLLPWLSLMVMAQAASRPGEGDAAGAANAVEPAENPDDPPDLFEPLDPAVLHFLDHQYQWRGGPPILQAPAFTTTRPSAGTLVSFREPTAVAWKGKWHLFVTVGRTGSPQKIAWASLQTLDAPAAVVSLAGFQTLELMDRSADVSSAQVFYFEPMKKWMLIYQVTNRQAESGAPSVTPMYSLNDDIENPAGWSRGKPIGIPHAPFATLWRDFRAISEGQRMHLYYTTADGQVFHSHSRRADFPMGLTEPVRALRGDFISGARVYLMQKLEEYLMIVEARDLGRRYLKAYIAPHAEGPWSSLATSLKNPLIAPANVKLTADWTDSFAEGEFLRAAADQSCPIDLTNLRLLFAGSSEADRAQRGPGEIPWKIGVVELLDAAK